MYGFYPDPNSSFDFDKFNGYIAVLDFKNGFVKAGKFVNGIIIEDGTVEELIEDELKLKNITNRAPSLNPCGDDPFCGGGSGSGNSPSQHREVIIPNNYKNPPKEVVYFPRGVNTSGGNTSSFTSGHSGGGSGGGGGIANIINLLTGKAKCIYEKLMASDKFKNAVKKFDGEFSVSHLKLTINNNLDTNVFGITIPPVNYVTEIQFDNAKLGKLSDLGNVTVFAHEIIHAEIFRKMLSAAQHGNLDPATMNTQQQTAYVNSLKDNYPGLVDYYYSRFHSTWNHNMMAVSFRIIYLTAFIFFILPI